uniref:Ras-related protein RABB1b-like n=1 Tax=Rhizophora mucronata TaxID=61149 RepID=A0A2P2JC58_RHIMU
MTAILDQNSIGLQHKKLIYLKHEKHLCCSHRKDRKAEIWWPAQILQNPDDLTTAFVPSCIPRIYASKKIITGKTENKQK